ncbi:MAG: hypothetical protein U0P45_13825 [Acidimicrobiales bacterium]
MTDELADPTVALAPVAAYPRRALEQYLADARRAEGDLRGQMEVDRRRLEVARRAVDACAEGHRLLGSMMVAAQQDLAARRRHTEEAAATLVREADAEAERILSCARADATAIVRGLPLGASAGADEGSRRDPGDPGEPGAPAPSPVTGRLATLPPPPPSPTAVPPVGDGAAADAPPTLGVASVAALAAALPALALGRRTGRGASHGPRWRSRRRGGEPFEWPFNPADRDEEYFSRLRDELHAEGALGAWFETA